MREQKRVKRFSFEYFFYDFAKVTAALPGLVAFRPKYLFENEKAKRRIWGGAILIGNHNGYFDPIGMMLCVYYRRHRFVCTKEFFEGRKGFFFRNFRCIAIDRDNFSVDAFREIVESLQKGEIVSMFPEGRIIFDDALAAFKSGMVLMAMKSGCPIVPIYVLKRRNYWERLIMAVGEPVDVREALGGKSPLSGMDAVSELLHEKEVKLKKLCEEARGK